MYSAVDESRSSVVRSRMYGPVGRDAAKRLLEGRADGRELRLRHLRDLGEVAVVDPAAGQGPARRASHVGVGPHRLGPVGSLSSLSAAAPAAAIFSSCSGRAPETPTAPARRPSARS